METLTKSSLPAMERLQKTVAGLAKQLGQAVEEAELNTRVLVEEELGAKFKVRTAAEVEAVRKELLAVQGKLRQELEQMQQKAEDWKRERSELVAESLRSSQLLDQSREEHIRALAETDEAAAIALEVQITTAVDRVRAELTARFNTEREELVAERDRSRKEFTSQDAKHQEAMVMVDRFRSEMSEERDRLRRALEQATTASVEFEAECKRLQEENEHAHKLLAEAAEQPSKKSGIDVGTLQAEVARIEGLIKDISQIIEDPATELSVVIRKNAERGELDSYLRGIRFSIPGK